MSDDRPLGPDSKAWPDVQARGPYTFFLDTALVERARREVSERDVIRSIEAALAAAVDYQLWVREVSAGRRDPIA